MSEITLGKYFHNNTFFHRLDPRCKFLMLIIMMITIFLQIGYLGYALLAFIIVLCYLIAKLNLILIFKSLKPMWLMMIFLFIMNCLIVKTGQPYTIWKITIYEDAILNTVNVVCRLVLLISISTLFTATTKPLDITIAIEDLFSFLKVFHCNVHILSITISIALRFIPTILEETYRIMKAQASRGVDMVHGKLKEKFVAVTALIIPLILSAFSRSEELANAMEARNYDPYGKRTRYRLLKWQGKDTIMLFLSFLLFAGFLTCKIMHMDLDALLGVIR